MDLAGAGAALLGLQMFLCPASQSAAWHAVVQYRTILQREHLSFAFFPQSALPQTYSGLLVLTFSVLAGLLNEAEAVDDTEVLFPPGWLRISSGCVVITLPTGDLCGLLWRNLGFRGPNLRLRRTKEDRMDARRKANKNKWGNTFSFSRCQAPAAALTTPMPFDSLGSALLISSLKNGRTFSAVTGGATERGRRGEGQRCYTNGS